MNLFKPHEPNAVVSKLSSHSHNWIMISRIWKAESNIVWPWQMIPDDKAEEEGKSEKKERFRRVYLRSLRLCRYIHMKNKPSKMDKQKVHKKIHIVR